MNPVLMIAVALVAAAAAPASTPDAADDLAWMAGSWVSEGDSLWTEERWSRPRGGVMVGTALTGKGDTAQSYEFMRIARDGKGRLTFWGSPQGKEATPFPVAAGGEGEIVFLNPGHDYPQRIVYRREGAELVATISLADGSNPQTWRYRRR